MNKKNRQHLFADCHAKKPCTGAMRSDVRIEVAVVLCVDLRDLNSQRFSLIDKLDQLGWQKTMMARGGFTIKLIDRQSHDTI